MVDSNENDNEWQKTWEAELGAYSETPSSYTRAPQPEKLAAPLPLPEPEQPVLEKFEVLWEQQAAAQEIENLYKTDEQKTNAPEADLPEADASDTEDEAIDEDMEESLSDQLLAAIHQLIEKITAMVSEYLPDNKQESEQNNEMENNADNTGPAI
ncbi:hypothetical protein ACFORL_07855 [Legionella dresdenensis]|uniref:Uncharacterized protein n=1 Tax=Legionella dresdenensis TaxID=450200 RepID=A0ABV8CG72_9GAMM